MKALEDLAGSDGRGAEGDGTVSGSSEAGGKLGKFFGFGNALPGIDPALIAELAPVGEVIVIDGFATELGSEDFFDAGKVVEPGEDVGGGVVVEQAMVELFAEVFGEAGNFTDEGAGHRLVLKVEF